MHVTSFKCSQKLVKLSQMMIWLHYPMMAKPMKTPGGEEGVLLYETDGDARRLA